MLSLDRSPRRPAKPAMERSTDCLKGQSSGSMKRDKGKAPELKCSEEPQYIDTILKEIVVIEDVDSVETPDRIAELYLTFSNDLPSILPKTREYFEKILVDTGSVEISHKRRDRSNYAFSTVKILKILTPKMWGGDLRKVRYFDDNKMFPKVFSYDDYISAWEKFMFYQNDLSSHSWFFHPKLSKGTKIDEFPAWFLNWFYYWGPVSAIFPKGIDEVFGKYYQTYSNLNDNQALLAFFCSYEIPWIFKWSYAVDLHTGPGVHRLLRKVAVKWWPKFNEAKVLKDLDLPVTPLSYDMDEYTSSQEKLKSALKGVSRRDILDFLRNHSDTEDMDDDADPFGGPCAQSTQ